MRRLGKHWVAVNSLDVLVHHFAEHLADLVPIIELLLALLILRALLTQYF